MTLRLTVDSAAVRLYRVGEGSAAVNVHEPFGVLVGCGGSPPEAPKILRNTWAYGATCRKCVASVPGNFCVCSITSMPPG